VLIYFSQAAETRVAAVAAYLRSRPWAGEVYVDDELARVGMQAEDGLRIAVSMAKRPGTNPYGIPGLGAIGVRFEADTRKLGFGQHGGTGEYEQQPFLYIDGGGYRAGTRSTVPSAIVDIAPTILRYLGIETAPQAFDGKPLPLDG